MSASIGESLFAIFNLVEGQAIIGFKFVEVWQLRINITYDFYQKSKLSLKT